MIGHHGGNYVKAIVSLFSELNLDPTKFMIPGAFPSFIFLLLVFVLTISLDSYFDIGANRRWFFQNIATKNGVDFLVPEQWYSISKDIILATQVFPPSTPPPSPIPLRISLPSLLFSFINTS